jgi:type I restriction and modification enzyme subunit R-like protein
MRPIPRAIVERLASGVRRFQPILKQAKLREANEASTVLIVVDIISQVLGYDKYSELRSEFTVRGTTCDLAICRGRKAQMLVEVKAVGLERRDNHMRQAVDYAASHGADWAVLTNGIFWRVYKVLFRKPVEQELVLEFNLLAMNPRRLDDLLPLYLLSREGNNAVALEEYFHRRRALSRFAVAAATLTPAVLNTIRREVRRLSPAVHISVTDLKDVLLQEVLRTEALEGGRAREARRKLARMQAHADRERGAPEQFLLDLRFSSKSKAPGSSAAVPPAQAQAD